MVQMAPGRGRTARRVRWCALCFVDDDCRRAPGPGESVRVDGCPRRSEEWAMRRIPRLAGSLILWAGLNLAGCVAVPVGGYYGAWYAPYGQRYVTSEGLVVTYDSGPGSYVVVGRPGLYWWNGYYYRRHGGYWERSHHHRGPWVYRPADRVPFLAHKRGRGPRRPPQHYGPGRPPGSKKAHRGGPAPGHFQRPGWRTNRGSAVRQNRRFTPPQSQRRLPGKVRPGWEVTRRSQTFRTLPEAGRHFRAQRRDRYSQRKHSPGSLPRRGLHPRRDSRGTHRAGGGPTARPERNADRKHN